MVNIRWIITTLKALVLFAVGNENSCLLQL